MKQMRIELSDLNHTWFIDIDGTIFLHNEYLKGLDKILPSTIEFWQKIAPNDCIIITTARNEKYREHTEKILREHSLRYNHLIMGLPNGERILINDIKPDGLTTAVAVNVERNFGLGHVNITK